MQREAYAAAVLPPGPDMDRREQAFTWFGRPYALLDACAGELGDRFTLHVPGWGTPVVVVADPGAVREVFAAPPWTLEAGPALESLRPLLGAGSLFLLDGEAHRAHRGLVLPAFREPALGRQGATIQRIVRRTVAEWPEATSFSIHPALLALALEVIVRMVLGASRAEDRVQAIRHRAAFAMEAVSVSVAAAGGPAGGAARTRFERAVAGLDELLLEERMDRRGWPTPGEDVFQRLLDARLPGGLALTLEQLRDHVLTLLIAGHETTAAALTWTLVLLAGRPDAVARLRAEVAGLGADADPAALVRLPYLGSVVDEAMRLRPVVPVVGRTVLRPAHVAGLVLEPGMGISPCSYLAHRRPDAFDRPLEFRPERFHERRHTPFQFFPFGGGRRRCTGAGLALYEMRLALAELVTIFDLTLVDGDPVRPVRRSAIVAPSGATRFTLTRRRRTARC
jgi:cytochrome P450 family 110